VENTTSLYTYDRNFFAYQREGSLRSSRKLLAVIYKYFKVRSVLDVGCGAGAWLAAHIENGTSDVLGIDGPYLNKELLLFPPEKFFSVDITSPFSLNRSYDIVQCLEVAEHIYAAKSEALIDNLVAHGSVILFSAAPPGQGGENHINERPYEFWRRLFAKRGYEIFDIVRPNIANDNLIEPWYRYNTFIFIKSESLASLHEDIKATRIPAESPILDISPPTYKLRKILIALLPISLCTMFAIAKSRFTVWKFARNAR
jgi:SAM-dependent methyltransferase